MITDVIAFEQLAIEQPNMEALRTSYQALLARAQAPDADYIQVFSDYEQLKRGFDSWDALVGLKFAQDTTDAAIKATKTLCDELRPQVEELEVSIKRALLEQAPAQRIAAQHGEQLSALWQTDVLAFAPALKALKVQESALVSAYVELVAGAKVQVGEQRYSLSELSKLDNDADRQVRLEANRARFAWTKEHEESLDKIYDELVGLRHQMAVALGEESYTPVGYKKMRRIDYGQEDVANFRREVQEVVVPLVTELQRRRAQRLGLEQVFAWDEKVYDLEGNPSPRGDHDWMVGQAQQMFDQLHPELSKFFALMSSRNYMDLKAREGKATGGFCTSFSTLGMPFIFANFNGSKGDVEVFTHEMGHAFQNYLSADKGASDYHWPTTEAAEIHSMSLEFLTWPQMELFFGDDAERFRQIHLAESLSFLPYGVAVDHFQHLVYAQPEASPEQRRQWWDEMEQLYMPWRQWGELEDVAKGRRWQLQNHIYSMPFYYIDYTLALTCALQFWAKMQHDFEGTMQDYVALCRRGGQLPFGQLVASAGLNSPFKPGSLRQVVELAKVALGM